MNLYRVQYYLVTRAHSETVRGQEFHHRTGLEKTAFVVAETQEAAAAHVQSKHECDILGVHVQQKDVEVANVVSFDRDEVVASTFPDAPEKARPRK